MEKSESIVELAKALVATQATLTAAKKRSDNPFFHSSYADLATIWEVCRKPLSSNGLAVIQTTDIVNDQIILETTLLHISGQWISGKLAIKPVKPDPQGIGSAITYARRYALAAMIGITAEDEDDDAEKAMGRETETKELPQMTEAQSKKLYAIAKEKDIVDEIKAYIATTFGKAHTRELNKAQASQLIEAIEKGEIKKTNDGK